MLLGDVPAWGEETDVIAVGSGIGAMASAIVAHDEGLDVLVLEKESKLGGVTAWSYGQVWVPHNHVAAGEGIEDSREHSLAYLQFMAGGFAEPDLQTAFLDGAPEACRYFGEQARVPWQLCHDFSDYHYPTSPGSIAQGRFLDVAPVAGADLGADRDRTRLAPGVPNGITHDEMFGWGGPAAFSDWDLSVLQRRTKADERTLGPGLAAAFIRAALADHGIRALTDSPVRELVVDGEGAVVGVRAERDGGDHFVRARAGVILAIGGYDHRPDIARSFEGMPEWHSASPPGIDGDNLVMGGEIGAATAALPAMSLAVLLGYQIPGEQFEGSDVWRFTFEGGLPGVIVVNRAGRRFADESFYREWLPKLHHWDGLRQEYSNFPAFMVFDEAYRRRYPFGPLPPGSDLPEELIARADTPAELAAKLGVDGAALEETVTRFNAMAAEGVDADFGRGSYPWANFMCGDLRQQPNPNLGPLATPPYYGLRLSMVAAGINAAGLRFDRHGRVAHVRGHVIPGLYAVGNSTAHLDTGAGYQSGYANCRGMTWGYIAGRHVAERARAQAPVAGAVNPR